MRVTQQILATANLNPTGKEWVVIEGYDIKEVAKLLPNALLIAQNTEEEYEDFMTCETAVLNTIKPSKYVCNNPTDDDRKLCKFISCEILSLEQLQINNENLVSQDIKEDEIEPENHNIEPLIEIETETESGVTDEEPTTETICGDN